MGVAPAEPLGDRAAEFTFEINEICAVFGTTSTSDTKLFCRAFSTHQILGLELLRRLLGCNTILHTAEVCSLALEAFVVCQFEDGPRLQVIVIYIVGILQAWVLINAFILGTLY